MNPEPGSRTQLIWKTDSEFRLTHLEGASRKLFGVSPVEAIGWTLWDLAGIDCDGCKWAKFIKLHRTHRPYEGMKLSFHDAGHALHRISVSGTPRFSKAGRLLGYSGSIEDVGASEGPQPEDDNEADKIDAIRKVVELSTAGAPVERLAEVAAQSLARALGARLVGLLTVYPEKRELRLRGAFGVPPEMAWPSVIPLDRLSPFVAATRTLTPVVFAEGEADFLPGRTAAHLPGAAVSIVARTGVAGIISVHFDGRQPSGSDLDFLHLFASVLGPVSASLRAENRLRLYERALDTVDRGVLVANPDLVGAPPIFVNDAFARMTGYRAEDMAGLREPDLYGARGGPEMPGGEGAGMQGPASGDLVQVRRKDGSAFWANLSTLLTRADDGLMNSCVSVLSDTNERMEMLERLQSVEKVSLIGQLAGGMAHDFNNLLTVILGNAEILLEGVSDPRLRDSAGLITESAERCAAMTHRLLDFGRKKHLSPEAIELDVAVQAAGAFLANALGTQVDLHVSTSGHARVLADRGLLESAILNLAMNARDAMPEGGRLSIEAGIAGQRATVGKRHAFDNEHYVEIVVSDSGHGMSENMKAYVLEPFFTTKKDGKGSGLGLPLVHAFVKLFSGHLLIDSVPGAGTTVRIYLRRAMPGTSSRKRQTKSLPARAGDLAEA